jgi:hypothetical protein
VVALCIAAVGLFASLSLIDDRVGEPRVLFVPPFGLLWLVSGVLILIQAHRAAARSSSSLLRFVAPIVAALAFLVCTGYVGEAIASYFSTHGFPHQRLLP